VQRGVAPKVSQITGRRYASFEVMDSSDWSALLILGLATAFLSWFALRAVRGRLPSALATDMAEMDEYEDEAPQRPQAHNEAGRRG
jgi:hypothetical protein